VGVSELLSDGVLLCVVVALCVDEGVPLSLSDGVGVPV